MRKSYISSILALGIFTVTNAQTYPPQVGQPGSTAISKDDARFVAWAAGCTVTRGPQQIGVAGSPNTSAGDAANVPGIANNTIVSLGDGGSAIVTFAKPIKNGAGADFAVFENGYISNFTGRAFLELAFVEVSSDGVNYFRFPAVNQYPANFVETAPGDPGGSGFATMDATYLQNFAGKYTANYGTPFDLDEIPDNPLLNKDAITHVKIIDVIGTNQLPYRTYDSLGNVAIDPFPTPYATGGFDLDAVGVINESNVLATSEILKSSVKIYPNPAVDFVMVDGVSKIDKAEVFDVAGRQIAVKLIGNKIEVSALPKGVYILQINSKEGNLTWKFIKN